MAKEARISEMGLNIDGSIHLLGLFERFGALVAAKVRADEREACAQVCEKFNPEHPSVNYYDRAMAAAIRARSKP